MADARSSTVGYLPSPASCQRPSGATRTTKTHHEHETTDHVEYASKNPAATRNFLEAVLGFHFEVMEAMGGYGMRTDENKGGSGTGVRALMPGESPMTIAYLTVKNLEESLHAAEKAGAKIVLPKTEIPNMGWHAVVHAPGDVPVGLYQAK